MLGRVKYLKKLMIIQFDLIVTSPPYADRRKIPMVVLAPMNMLNGFYLSVTGILRVLKPTGTFILNIKEKSRKW